MNRYPTKVVQENQNITMSAPTIEMSSSAIILNEFNVVSGIHVKQKNLLSDQKLWHKIIVNNCENTERNYILKILLDFVHPFDFIPVYYRIEGNNAMFFARNCRMAIEKLCQQNLVIPNPHNLKPLKLTIILAFASTKELKINVQKNISAVLNKRHNSFTKALNLDGLSKDPELTEYCALSQPKVLYFVLHLSGILKLQSIKLSNNDIRILSPIENICSLKTLTSIDLRNNMIEKMTEVEYLKALPITEIWLDGNPICDDFDEYSYVQAIKEYFPKVEKLDGVLLGQNGFLAFRRNFMCNSGGHDLVNQFLEHYFTLYDSQNRSVLEGLYHEDATFSLTAQYLPGQISSNAASLVQYENMSHNIKLITNLAKSTESLFCGRSKVIEVLSKLPLTEHDPYMFTVDLMYFTESLAILMVTGVFREPTHNLLDAETLLGFARTFVLSASGNGEYNIINEQLYVTNAMTNQQQRAFKVTRVSTASYLTLQPAYSEKEKSEMAQTLQQISTLNVEWSKKCLEECHYDLKKALMLFVDLYKVDKIPKAAFIV